MVHIHNEEGFSLVELLVTITIGMIVVFAVLQIFDVGWSTATSVDARQEATLRARSAVAGTTRLLQARVCNGTVGTNATAADVTPIRAATKHGVVFTAATGDINGAVKGYKALFDPDTSTYTVEPVALDTPPLAETGYAPWQGGAPSLPTPDPAAGTIFTYYRWRPADATTTPATTADMEQVIPSGANGALTDAERKSIIEVKMNFSALPQNNRPADATVMEASAMATSSIVTSQLELGPQC